MITINSDNKYRVGPINDNIENQVLELKRGATFTQVVTTTEVDGVVTAKFDELLSNSHIGYLGTIDDVVAPAPTPRKNGWYKFSVNGNVTWITIETIAVKIGDEVSVEYTSNPPTHTYTYINRSLELTDAIDTTSSVTAASATAVKTLNTNKVERTFLNVDDFVIPIDKIYRDLVITSFTGGQVVEIGSTITDPTFNWSYNKPNVTAQSLYGAVVTPLSSRSKTIINLFTTDTTITLSSISSNTVSSNQYLKFKYYKFWGTGTVPSGATDDLRRTATISKNPSFQDIAAGTFVLNTGTTDKTFWVLLPPGLVIASAVDTTANATVTFDTPSNYVMNDAGGVARTYKLYAVTLGAAFSSSHNWTITLAIG
jgi:hypothetical protein